MGTLISNSIIMATRSARAFIDAAETVSAITATNPSWRFTCLRTPDADAAASFYQENFDFTLLHTLQIGEGVRLQFLGTLKNKDEAGEVATSDDMAFIRSSAVFVDDVYATCV